MVQVRVFNREGSFVGPVDSPRVTLSDAEWQSRLTPEQFRVLRSKGTERPFCGTLLDNKQQGVYVCAGCGLPLFSSDAKFQSGTGWPSFFQPMARENIAEETDKSHGMVRVEILCARCDGHLGHVFEDGPRPTGLRYCLNSESLFFTPSEHLAKLADPAAESGAMPAASGGHASTEEKPSGATGGLSASANGHTSERKSVDTATAIFAGGCFWCTEAAFEQLDGVLDVESGYIGGKKETANYERVCDGNTGHAEAIRITYDPRRITYDQLLDVFFDAHDPTQLNRQGNDYGTQYRSAIFFADEREKGAAVAKIAALNKSGAFDKPIVTTLEPLETFYPAEAYHQDYARNNPEQPYIQYQANPKVCKVRTKHAKLIRKDS